MTHRAGRRPENAIRSARHHLLMALVQGKAIDGEGRCIHHDAEDDVVLLRFACCNGFWPCRACHDESAGHAARAWQGGEGWEEVVACGDCGHILALATYLHDSSRCPACGTSFSRRPLSELVA